MRLSSISITDFLGVGTAAIEFGDVTTIAGENWSGKTSLRQAIRLILSGVSERGITLATKKSANRHLLVKEGAKEARILCATDIGLLEGRIAASSNYETQRRETMLPVCQDDLLPHILSPNGYSGADDDMRKKILFWMAAKAYNPDDIKKQLVDRKFSEEKIERLMPNLVSGKFEAAVNQCDLNIRKCRNDWGQITGEAYGDKKYKTWAAPEFKVTPDDLKNKEQRRDAINRTIQHYEKDLLLRPYECENCGKRVAEIPEDYDDNKRMSQEYSAEVEKINAEIVTISTQLEHNKRAAEKTEAALKKGDDLNEWKGIKEALGPDGIQGEVLKSAMSKINERLAEISIFQKTLYLDAETCAPIVEGRPYSLASEAEQFLSDAYLQMMLSMLSGTNVVLIDRFDVLHPSLRAVFLKELIGNAKMNGLQSVLFGTLKAPIKFNGVKSYWMNNGTAISASDQ